MDRADQFRSFLSEYEKYIKDILKPELRRIRGLFELWKTPDYWSRFTRSKDSPYPNPIRAVYTRIKRPERVIDKIFRKSPEYPAGIAPDSFYRMHDCLGARIIVYFLSQMPYIDHELRSSKSFEISPEFPPEGYLSKDLLNRFGLSHIAYKEKESGYSSVHYIVRVKSKPKCEGNHPWFEIQVRTLAQELWCEMEHMLAYKSEESANYSAKRRLQILSSQINSVDEQFNLLYEELIQNQEKCQYADEDELNPESLPYALSLIGIRCAQQDFDLILSILESRGVKTIRDFANLATTQRLENIRNTYITVTGRPPDNFELIASLASLLNLKPGENESIRIESHIEFSKFWNRFRKKISSKDKPVSRFYKV